MHNGEVLNVHLPRPPRNFWSRPPFGFFWTLGLAAVAVALATYPIIRKLTRRLEQLLRGVGLGLVKSIAERHGGTVHCEDREGSGARFIWRIPTWYGA